MYLFQTCATAATIRLAAAEINATWTVASIGIAPQMSIVSCHFVQVVRFATIRVRPQMSLRPSRPYHVSIWAAFTLDDGNSPPYSRKVLVPLKFYRLDVPLLISPRIYNLSPLILHDSSYGSPPSHPL